ncbi:MAG: MerR family DNA-binding transcriptional regulator [Alphaproteobacteria bacterium]|nr:MAG: MerR family DNA-binding transcriptional regulator [Alphaproteobacteria bacterium]
MSGLSKGELTSSKDSTFSIRQLASECGLTTRAIRFYEDKGLIAPTRKGQTRVYSRRDRVRLQILVRAKGLGLSLNEIAELLDLYDAEDGLQKQGRVAVLKINERIEELERQRRAIDATIGEMQQIARTIEKRMAERAASDNRSGNDLIGYGVVPNTA